MSPKDPPVHIVIIGGAFAGTCALQGIRERFGQDLATGRLRVLMLDREASAGPGLAWGPETTSECHLSNLHVDRLAISAEFRPTFADWLVAEYPDEFAEDPHLEAAFPPRWYFGEYLRAARARLRNTPGIEIRDGVEAMSLRPLPNARWEVTIGSEAQKIEADFILLCTGAPTDAGAARFAHLAGRPGYVASPWPAMQLTESLRGATGIALIGTGLTAIDVIKHVARTVPDVPLLMASRRGRFNSVVRNLSRADVAGQEPYQPTVLTNELVTGRGPRIALSEFVDLIRTELEASVEGQSIDWRRFLSNDVDGVAELRLRSADYEDGNTCRWQLALMAIDDLLPALWHRLDDEERKAWYSSATKTVYQNYSNPMPHESAKELLELIDQGRVTVHGGLDSIEPLTAGGFRLRLPGQNIEVSHCINCTGVGADTSHSTDALTRQLLQSALVRPHAFGGFELDPDTFAARPGLYVVGHSARGTRYLTSGLGFLRSMVAAVLDDLRFLTDMVRPASLDNSTRARHL